MEVIGKTDQQPLRANHEQPASRGVLSALAVEVFYCFVFQLPVRFYATATASTRTAAASATAAGKVWNVMCQPTSALTSTVEDMGFA